MKRKTPLLVKHIGLWLTLILLIKIAGYFSIAEEKAINQVFKTISRMGMTGLIVMIYIRLKKMGCAPLFEFKNVLSPIFYVFYLILGMASFAWSTDPKYSILQWLMTFESFVFVYIYMKCVYLVNNYFPDKQIDLAKLFAWAIFPIAIVFIVGSFVEPDTFYRGMRGGEEKRLGGWIMNPNELGMLSSLGAAMGLIQIQAGKRFWYILMMVANCWILALTSSRSSAIGFVLIMFILIMLSDNKRMKTYMLALGAIGAPIMISQIVFKDSGGVEEVMSMTGRLPFWTALLNEGIVKEPFFGYGFMRINYTDYFQGLNTYPGKMTHNTFMQVLMNLGFVGFFIAFWQLVLTIRNYVVTKESPYRKFFIAMFIPITINSFTEFGFFGEANYGILFYQFLIFLFVMGWRQTMTPQEELRTEIFKQNWKVTDSQNGN